MSTSSAGICPDCAAVGFKRLGCETCRGMGMVPTPTAQPEPRTPDETLAADLDRLANNWHNMSYNGPNLPLLRNAAKRLRELAQDKARLVAKIAQVREIADGPLIAQKDGGLTAQGCMRIYGERLDEILRLTIDDARAAQPTEGADA